MLSQYELYPAAHRSASQSPSQAATGKSAPCSQRSKRANHLSKLRIGQERGELPLMAGVHHPHEPLRAGHPEALPQRACPLALVRVDHDQRVDPIGERAGGDDRCRSRQTEPD